MRVVGVFVHVVGVVMRVVGVFMRVVGVVAYCTDNQTQRRLLSPTIARTEENLLKSRLRCARLNCKQPFGEKTRKSTHLRSLGLKIFL